jgi:hypothetical protein
LSPLSLIVFYKQTLIEDMQMRLSALESVQNAAEELIKQASDSQDDAVKGMLHLFI